MAFFYIRDNKSTFTGTATADGGRETTARTGSWNATTSQSYATVAAALAATTPPTDGDILIFGDDHAESSTGSDLQITLHTDSESLPIYMVSNDVTAQDTYKKGASIATSGAGLDIYISGAVCAKGLKFDAANGAGSGSQSTGGHLQVYIDCEFVHNQGNSVSGSFNMSSEQQHVLIGCTFSGGGGGSDNNPINGANGYGYFFGCNLGGSWDTGSGDMKLGEPRTFPSWV